MIKELDISSILFSHKDTNIDFNYEEQRLVGQDRALEAIKLGLSTDSNGYNIFISGDVSTGRLASVKQEYGNLDTCDLFDVLFVHNPKDKNSPYSLTLKAGEGKLFKSKMASINESNFISTLEDVKANIKGCEEYIDLVLKHGYSSELNFVNLAIERVEDEKRPLIIETHPSFENLFGYCDKNEKLAHMMIQLGSYHKAGSGFLVINAEEVLAEKGLWDALKRELDSTEMAFVTREVLCQIGKAERIRPYAIALRTKVILLGGETLFDSLSEKDPQFLRLFKIAPQFDYLMDLNEDNIKGSVNYIKYCAKEINKNITEDAIKELLRYSAWFAEGRDYLTSQVSILRDLIIEASSLVKDTIDRADILASLNKRNYIGGINEEKINNDIKNGDLIIEVEGSRIGIVNGLAVMDRGIISFGTPAVISATVAPGSEGIINIEHEAGLSGEIHDKGLLILEGYLRKQYARNFPLSIYAGICFEQNYCEIDGDSASSSELYALLSAIGEIPIRSDIGVTGSVNQMGFLQPVGGINEKIIGFYKTCKTCGLTKTQGVIIPKQNLKTLILDYEVEEAIKRKEFHIWALSTIEEGFELLSGLESGKRDKKGNYPNGTFNRIIENSLKKLYQVGQSN